MVNTLTLYDFFVQNNSNRNDQDMFLWRLNHIFFFYYSVGVPWRLRRKISRIQRVMYTHVIYMVYSAENVVLP